MPLRPPLDQASADFDGAATADHDCGPSPRWAEVFQHKPTAWWRFQVHLADDFRLEVGAPDMVMLETILGKPGTLGQIDPLGGKVVDTA